LRQFYISCEPSFGAETSEPIRARQIFLSSANNVAYHTLPKSSVNSAGLKIWFAAAAFGAFVSSTMADGFPATGPTISGSTARLRRGRAAAPEHAPLAVKRAIWAANQVCSKPYRYGGGHRSFQDGGYDCSGTISYALGGAGLINSPMSSDEFRQFGKRGRGKWITIYARPGHSFAVIAGLRLDTTPFITGRERWKPAWQPTPRAPVGFEARHPVGL
jgi:hypothetical protein